MDICRKCGSGSTGKFCSTCGEPIELRRIDGGYILHELGSVFNFEKGIFYSIRELLFRPGKTIRDFILGDRNRLVKPIIFLILCSLIYTATNQIFHWEDGYVSYKGAKDSATTAIFAWIQHNYGYANIIMGAFVAFWTKKLFRKYDYNYFEILILICFVMGMGMLLFSVAGIMIGIFGTGIVQIASILGVIYSSWAIGSFFDKDRMPNYLKALASYILGFVTFSFSAIGLGAIIDLILKNGGSG